MRAEEAAIVRYRLERADQSLGEAALLLDGDRVSGAVNRLYYACFYAVSALLYSTGRASSKHSGVLALFEQHFVRTGEVSTERGRFYRSLFKRRQRGDYDDLVTFDRAEVGEWLTEATEFVREISEKTEQITSQQEESQC